MKLNKKGLTLVELISVLVVLILIFLLAVNKVNDLMDETEIKSVKADSISYVKAVNDFFTLKNGENIYPIYEGVFYTDELNDIGIKVAGTKPDSGYIYNVGNKSVYGCLMYEKRRVIINDNLPTKIDRGRCSLIVGYNESVKLYRADYTGYEEVFDVPEAGYYLLEVWGAQGGSYSDTYQGGYGGYSSGVVLLHPDDKLYINVGGKGTDLSKIVYGLNAGGYNGGGASYSATNNCNNYCGSGGGATSISKVTGTLKDIGNDNSSNVYIVAGGGGGASYRFCNAGDTASSSGGHGGGALGNEPKSFAGTYNINLPSGGNQTVGGYSGTVNSETGGADGSFGLGGATARAGGYTCGTGGGGGFWGGGNGMFIGAGGGSGYIANPLFLRKHMYCYDCLESTVDNFETISTTCVDDTPRANCAKKGNGYAKITLVKSLENYDNETTYTIAYNLNGGTLSAPNRSSFTSADEFTLNNPTKEGYDFAGWTKDDDLEAKKNLKVVLGSVGNRTYTAHYTKSGTKYEVTFDYNLPNNPYLALSSSSYMNSGYFINWKRDYKLEMVANFPNSGRRYLLIGNFDSANQLNLEIIDSNNFRVYSGGDRAWPSSTISFNEDMNFEFKFNGKTKQFQGSFGSNSSSESFSGTIDLYNIAGNPLRLGHDYRGGNAFSEFTLKDLKITDYYSYEEVLKTFPEGVTIPGKTFLGWYTDPVGGVKVPTTINSIPGDITFYAHWN